MLVRLRLISLGILSVCLSVYSWEDENLVTG